MDTELPPSSPAGVERGSPAGGGGVGDGVDHVGGQRVQDARQKLVLFGTWTT